MAYESYPMFENDNFTFSQISTSRCFFLKMNFNEGSVCTDPAVRKAIAMGIDKEGFVENLLEGNGYPANGTFPAGSAFGGDKVTTETYDAEGAKKVLEEAGWTDTDGDGIREKTDRSFWYGSHPVLKDLKHVINCIYRYIHIAYLYRKKACLCEKKNLKWKDRG